VDVAITARKILIFSSMQSYFLERQQEFSWLQMAPLPRTGFCWTAKPPNMLSVTRRLPRTSVHQKRGVRFMVAQETEFPTRPQVWVELEGLYLIVVGQEMCYPLPSWGKYRIVFDSWKGNHFIMHKPDSRWICSITVVCIILIQTKKL